MRFPDLSRTAGKLFALWFSLYVFDGVPAYPIFSAPKPLAIVIELRGEAWITGASDKNRRSLDLFDWMCLGDLIESGPDSMITIVFSTGDRFRLGATTRAKIGRGKFGAVSGPFTRLASVDVMPRVSELAQEFPLGTQLAGIRLRSGGDSASRLYPSGGATALPDETVLSFRPQEGAQTFIISIEDDSGNRVFSQETTSSEIPIPPGLLRSKSVYYWGVQGLDRDRPESILKAAFSTISEAEARTLNIQRNVAIKSDQSADFVLLAYVEMTLGLWKESCGMLKTALKISPQNDRIKRALSSWFCME